MDTKARVALLVEAQGAKRTERDLKSVASATGDVGDQASKAGRRMSVARGVADKFGGALRTLGRWAQRGAIAVGGVAATGIGLGLKLNAQWESVNASFKTFLGSTRKAEKFTERLRTVSAKSPLRLTEYAEGAKLLLGFGMKARKTIPLLHSVNKAVVATGGGAEQMQAVVDVLGEMHARGRVFGEDLTRLVDAGMPVNRILQKELGLTSKQMANIGDEAISSEKALDAIRKGWNKQFAGGYKDAEDTFAFQIARSRKMFEQGLRLATEPLFNELTTDVLPRANKEMQEFVDILNDDSLSTGQKWDRIRHRVHGLVGELSREIDRADLDDKLLQAFEDFVPMAAEAAGKGAGKVAWAFFKGWLKAGIWGKLFTVGFLAGKLGAFGPLASIAAKKFMLKFAPQLAAKMGIEMAASGAIGQAATGSAGALGTKAGRLFGAGFAAAAAIGLALLLKEYEDEISAAVDDALNQIPGNDTSDHNVVPGTEEMRPRSTREQEGGANTIPGASGPERPRTRGGPEAGASRLAGRGRDLVVPVFLDGREVGRGVRRVALHDLLTEAP